MLLAALGDASACVGATVPAGRAPARSGATGRWFVAEADESDRSLLPPDARRRRSCSTSTTTTTRRTPAWPRSRRSFARSSRRSPPRGSLVVGPDPRARAVAGAARCPVRTRRAPRPTRVWPGSPPPGAPGFTLALADGRRVPVPLAVPGAHNRTNAACALALADWCGVDPRRRRERLAGFPEWAAGSSFAARPPGCGWSTTTPTTRPRSPPPSPPPRESHPGRLVAVFQPHLYSRTKALAGELGGGARGGRPGRRHGHLRRRARHR